MQHLHIKFMVIVPKSQFILIYNYILIYIYIHYLYIYTIYIYIYTIYIRRPRPSPRQGRRLGPPQVWSLFLLACHYLAVRQLRKYLKRQPSNPYNAYKPLKPLTCSAAASTRHSCHCRLLLRAFKPVVCQP